MLAHTQTGKLIHIADDERVTRCQKRVDSTWLTHEEALAAGNGLNDCAGCGTPAEFAAHRQHLRTAYANKQQVIAQAKAAQQDATKAKAAIAQNLAGQIAQTLAGLGVQANFAKIPAGARVDATYKKDGHVFRFSFNLF